MRAAAIAAFVFLAAATAAAPKPIDSSKVRPGQPLKPRPAPTVVKYVGAKQGRAWGQPVVLLVVAPRKGGRTASLVVPNQDPEAGKLNPNPLLVSLVKSLKPGDLIEIRTMKLRGQNILRSIGRYEPKPGEDDPKAFTFVKTAQPKIDGQQYLAVVLQKDRKFQTLLVPNRKDERGAPAPDEKLAEKVRKLVVGDVVEVEAARVGAQMQLKDLKPYKLPEKANFLKLITTRHAEQKHLAVRIRRHSGEADELLIPNRKNLTGKTVHDPELHAAARKLRAGQPVLFRIREELGQPWLAEIRPALW